MQHGGRHHVGDRVNAPDAKEVESLSAKQSRQLTHGEEPERPIAGILEPAFLIARCRHGAPDVSGRELVAPRIADETTEARPAQIEAEPPFALDEQSTARS